MQVDNPHKERHHDDDNVEGHGLVRDLYHCQRECARFPKYKSMCL
ncbi:hypothetical phage protein [Shigella phage Ag3]|uniref:Hypothetical phage protein n=1 Tax=Shigella phage Ag3 TaxID=637730 RepID=C8XUK7_9CAUD|nr:hypothetical protein phiSboM-AG3_gp103 [Shigella phage Ag3]ACO94337.1 hypothetical phage protein [Shigella phage Ag3]